MQIDRSKLELKLTRKQRIRSKFCICLWLTRHCQWWENEIWYLNVHLFVRYVCGWENLIFIKEDEEKRICFIEKEKLSIVVVSLCDLNQNCEWTSQQLSVWYEIEKREESRFCFSWFINVWGMCALNWIERWSDFEKRKVSCNSLNR